MRWRHRHVLHSASVKSQGNKEENIFQREKASKGSQNQKEVTRKLKCTEKQKGHLEKYEADLSSNPGSPEGRKQNPATQDKSREHRHPNVNNEPVVLSVGETHQLLPALNLL